jgi:hypothetical protein
MNKLKIFIVVFSLCIVQFAEAQKAIGLRVGGVGSNYKFTEKLDNNFDSEMQYSVTGGIFYNQPIGQGNFSISPELMYSYQRKNKINAEEQLLITYKDQKTGGAINYTERVSSIDFNILFRYKFPAKFISPYLETGPSWLFLSNGKGSIDSLGGKWKDYTVEVGSSNNDKYKSYLFGWIVGGGLSAEFDFGTVSLGIRYLGTRNAINEDKKNFPLFIKDDNMKEAISIGEDDKMKLKNLILNISYTYPLGGYR